jgi:glycosyltransferase involved in cell wall biosynthesis
MRILLLHSSSDIYGASKIFLQTVQLLQSKGHTPVVALSNEGALSIALEKCGVHVHIVNLAILRRKYFNLKGLLNRYQRWKQAVRELDYIITTHQIDTVYSNTAAVLVGAYIAKKRKLQHIWHLHEIIERPVFLHRFIAWCLRKATDKIIVVSKAVEANWQDALNKPNKNNPHSKPIMYQVYNGISAPSINATSLRAQYGIPDHALVIGMAARIHFWKGQPYFINIARTLLLWEAAGKINLHQRPLYFIIAGDPFPGYEHLQLEMEKSIQQHHIGDRVIYVGLVKQMALFYNAIDLLVLPSQQPDPLPTVVLEAMQFSKPVVATAQGGALEMVIGKEEAIESNLDATGIFIPLTEVEKSAQIISSILIPETLNTLGAAGKRRVDEYFSVAAFEKNILTVFETALN